MYLYLVDDPHGASNVFPSPIVWEELGNFYPRQVKSLQGSRIPQLVTIARGQTKPQS